MTTLGGLTLSMYTEAATNAAPTTGVKMTIIFQRLVW